MRSFTRSVAFLALILVIQLFQWVVCSEISGLESLTSKNKYELYTLLSSERISFLSKYLLEGEKEVNIESGEQMDCLLNTRYSKLINIMAGDHSFDEVLERRIAIKCLMNSLKLFANNYSDFLNNKFISKPSCLSKICKKKPEKILFKEMEDLALSAYSIFTLNDFVKANSGFVKEIDFPQELEFKSEVISILDHCEKFDSYKSGLKVCMDYNMLTILIFPGFNKNSLLSDFKIFTSISRILAMKIRKQVNLYKCHKRCSLSGSEKNYKKKISSSFKKVSSLIKLHSYVVLSRYFISSDIANIETNEQIYQSIFNSETED